MSLQNIIEPAIINILVGAVIYMMISVILTSIVVYNLISHEVKDKLKRLYSESESKIERAIKDSFTPANPVRNTRSNIAREATYEYDASSQGDPLVIKDLKIPEGWSCYAVLIDFSWHYYERVRGGSGPGDNSKVRIPVSVNRFIYEVKHEDGSLWRCVRAEKDT